MSAADRNGVLVPWSQEARAATRVGQWILMFMCDTGAKG